MKKIILYFLLSIFLFSCFKKNNINVSNDNSVINISNKFPDHCPKSNIDENAILLKFVNEMDDNDTQFKSALYNLINVSDDTDERFISAKELFDICQEKIKTLSDSDIIANCYFGIGLSFEKIGNLSEALKNYEISINNSNNINKQILLKEFRKKYYFKTKANCVEIFYINNNIIILSLEKNLPFEDNRKTYDENNEYILSLYTNEKNPVLLNIIDLGLKENSIGYYVDLKDVDNDSANEIIFGQPVGAHSEEITILKITNNDFFVLFEISSTAPSIYVEDIDGDKICEVIVKNRDYGSDPINNSIITIYKFENYHYVFYKEEEIIGNE